MQGEVAVRTASPGTAAAAPAEGLAPGVSVSVTVTNSSNTAAAPLVVDATPSPPTRRLLQTASNATGLNVNVTITAPASDVNNITQLVQQAVSSGQVQQELQQAGELSVKVSANADASHWLYTHPGYVYLRKRDFPAVLIAVLPYRSRDCVHCIGYSLVTIRHCELGSTLMQFQACALFTDSTA